HDHGVDFTWTANFQLRGDLVRDEGGWSLVPHRLVGGLEMPSSAIKRWTVNSRKTLRFRRTAKRELARRSPARADS
ncbi:hypothetical protein LCGC14_2880140, partial [marine sediment metagenome]